MKTPIGVAAAAFALIALPALAQDKATVRPHEMSVAAKRPPLQLNDKQGAAIRAAVDTEHTTQKTPDKFEPKVGEKIPSKLTVDAMPAALLAREPSLKQYGYAKLSKQVLVVDPMKKTIIAILPLAVATGDKSEPAADWAATRGRELTGQAPEPTGSSAPAMEPAGDSGDKSNGNEAPTQEK